jgi:alpha-tubulin suppressor-like RCC1 family protein
MGNSKDGKLGYELQIGALIDVEEPQKILNLPKNLQFFCNTVKKAVAKVYPLFDDYDEYGKLKPTYTKDDPYEVNQVACGVDFQLLLSNNGVLYSSGSNKYGQLGLGKDEAAEEEMNEEEKQ